MRVLLINPLTSTSLYTFSEIRDITGRPGYMPNLALPTVAALTRDDVEIRCVDESVEAINFDEAWDLVGITGYITQRKRMLEIADEFRRRGQLVAIGGPYATLSSSTVRPHADILFLGEAENTWPQFLADFRAGCWKSEYHAVGSVDLQASPLPDISKLKQDSYFMGVVQTSRGCPFECEFCDVIIYLGRKQRHKTPARVVEEIEQLYQAGYQGVFLSDDNLTANRKRAAEIMTAVGQWNRSKPDPIAFSTQLSIDVARDGDESLLGLCAEAGLKQAFVGIETPNPLALREVKKRQNLRSDLIADVHKIQKQGIMVQAGMITGFDSDTLDSFQHQYEFLQEAGVPMVSAGVLNAPEGTPLEKRLIRENRLKIEPMKDLYLDTNIIPKQMTTQQLQNGTRWLLNKIYSPKAFLACVGVLTENLPQASAASSPTRQSAIFWERILKSYERLGPEFHRIPREVAQLFRHKDMVIAISILMYYKHVVTVLRMWGAWSPELATLDKPEFNLPL